MREIYEAPDGRMLEYDPANPAHKAFIARMEARPPERPSPTWLSATASGLGEGAARLPFLMSDLANLGLDLTQEHFNPKWMQTEGYRDFRQAHKGSAWLDTGLHELGTGFYRPKNTRDKYLNLGAQGFGGGLATVGPRMVAPVKSLMFKNATMPADIIRGSARAAAVPSAVAGAVGAVTGQGLMDATDSQNPLIGLAGNVLGGGLTGFALTHRSPGIRQLSEAGQAHTAADFRKAAENLAKLRQVQQMPGRPGATATLGELFEGESPYLGFTQDATAQAGSNALIARMAQRGDDLQNLSRGALNTIAPETNSVDVANAAQRAAAQRVGQFQQLASDVFKRRMAAGSQSLDGGQVEALHDSLLQMARAPNTSGIQKDALTAVARVLLDSTPQRVVVQPPAKLTRVNGVWKKVQPPPEVKLVYPPKTDVQAIVDDLKGLRESLREGADGGQKLNAGAVNNAYRIVNEWLKQVDPMGYARAEAGYSKVMRQVDRVRESPIGAMKGADTPVERPTAVSRLNAIPAGQNPDAVVQTLQSLEQGTRGSLNQLRGGAAADTSLIPQIVRTILQERTASGQGNLADRLTGGVKGSEGAARTSAMVGAAGPNPQAFEQTVEVLRLLSRINSRADSGGTQQRNIAMGQNVGNTAVRPFNEAGTRLNLRARKVNYAKAAELLANPTPENLAMLYKLSRQDPALMRRLGLQAGVLGAGNTGLPPEGE